MAEFRSFGEIPDIGGGSVEESLQKLRDYLFLLREQLTFVLSNLGKENLNDAAAAELKTYFTRDIAGALADEEGRLAEIRLAADALNLSFADAEARLSTLEQDARGIALTVRDKDGKTSSVKLSSGVLDLKDLVFTVLGENGGTSINGGNIRTGTISAVQLEGVTITGSVLTSTSETSKIVLNDGVVAFYDGAGAVLCGNLRYDGMGRVSLASHGQADLQLYSDADLYIDAADGGEIWLGSGEHTTQRICIGNANSSIEILGNVTINGKTWSV